MTRAARGGMQLSLMVASSLACCFGITLTLHLQVTPRIVIEQYTPTVGFEAAHLCCLSTNMLEEV